MMKRIAVARTAVAAAAALGIALAAAPAAQATGYSTYYVPGGTAYVQVTSPASHGYLVHFAVHYAWDSYVHQDILSAASRVSEIDNFTGRQPDTYGYDGCASPTAAHPANQPDELFNTDYDAYGIPGQQPHTVHNRTANLTFTPKNNGKIGYHWFLWCHYEHGPETWVALTFSDGRTDDIWWNTATYFSEILITYGGTSTAVTAVPADD